MTRGIHTCPTCGGERWVPIDEFIDRCAECGQEFELIEMVEGAHSFHRVPIWTVKGESEEYSNDFEAFHTGDNAESIDRYFTALRNLHRRIANIGM